MQHGVHEQSKNFEGKGNKLHEELFHLNYSFYLDFHYVHLRRLYNSNIDNE